MPIRITLLLWLSLGLFGACGEESTPEQALVSDAEDVPDVAFLDAVDVGASETLGTPEGDGGQAGDAHDDGSPSVDAVARELDATPVAQCSGPGDPSLTAEAQTLCETCISLPPLGSVPQEPLPLAPPFERVEGLEGLLHDPTFLYGDFGMISSVLAIDMNADGREDLVVSASVGGEGFDGSPVSRVLFGSEDGGFTGPSPLPIFDPSLTILSAADLNGDGLRDLLGVSDDGIAVVWNTMLGFVSAASMITWLEPPVGLEPNTPLSAVVYTFTVMDFEGDGDTDIVVALFGGPNQAWRNDGGQVFTDVSEALGLVDSGVFTFFLAPFAWSPSEGLHGLFGASDGADGKNVAIQIGLGANGELAGQFYQPIPEACDVVRTSMCGALVGTPCDEAFMENMGAVAGQGGGNGATLSSFAGVGVSRPMGVGCLFHEGAQPTCVMGQTDAPAPDYVVTHREGDQWGLLSGAIDLPKIRTTGGHIAVSWAVLPVDDGDGNEDLLITTGDNEEFHTAGSSMMSIMMLQNFLGETLADERGESRVAYYRGKTDGRYEEVGEAWGFSGWGHYVTAAPVWLEVDGKPAFHLIMGGFGQELEVYRLVRPRGNLIRLRLRGIEDNPDGLGARVELSTDDRSWTRIIGWESTQIRTGNLHQSTTVGVGDALSAEIVVRWAGGLAESFGSLPANGTLQVLQQGDGVPLTSEP
jgi:hypothetical protein